MKLVLGTGTNAARAGTNYQVDEFINTTYFDMILSKGRLASGEDVYIPRRQLPFPVASSMDFVPDVEFYQIAWPGADELDDRDPSWTKVIENPNKAKGFIHSTFGALFNGEGNHEHLNFENIFGGHEPTGIMIWVSAGSSGKKVNVTKFANIIRRIAVEWEVTEIHGGFSDEENGKVNGTNNRNVEQEIKDLDAYAKKQGKRGVVVISSSMGSRSFSVPQIDTVILAYDNGSSAQTAQKMSRCLTPYPPHTGIRKIGRVLSLSLDPTREDKLDVPILETAEKYAEKEEIEDTEVALKKVLRSLNLLTIDNNGDRTKVIVDEYASKILSLKSLTDVFAKSVNLFEIVNDPDMLDAITNSGLVRLPRLPNPKVIREKGKKFLKNNDEIKNKKPVDEEEKEIKNLLEMVQSALAALGQNLQYVRYISPESRTIRDILKVGADIFYDYFNVEAEFVLMLLDEKVVSERLINLIISQAIREDEKALLMNS